MYIVFSEGRPVIAQDHELRVEQLMPYDQNNIPYQVVQLPRTMEDILQQAGRPVLMQAKINEAREAAGMEPLDVEHQHLLDFIVGTMAITEYVKFAEFDSRLRELDPQQATDFTNWFTIQSQLLTMATAEELKASGKAWNDASHAWQRALAQAVQLWDMEHPPVPPEPINMEVYQDAVTGFKFLVTEQELAGLTSGVLAIRLTAQSDQGVYALVELDAEGNVVAGREIIVHEEVASAPADGDAMDHVAEEPADASVAGREDWRDQSEVDAMDEMEGDEPKAPNSIYYDDVLELEFSLPEVDVEALNNRTKTIMAISSVHGTKFMLHGMTESGELLEGVEIRPYMAPSIADVTDQTMAPEAGDDQLAEEPADA